MNFQKILDYILRHSTYIVLIIVGLYLLGFNEPLMKVLITITLIEGVALGLSALSVYAYTNHHANEVMFKGKDSEWSVLERVGSLIFAGLVFLGVHILAGLIVFSTYMIQFAQ